MKKRLAMVLALALVLCACRPIRISPIRDDENAAATSTADTGTVTYTEPKIPAESIPTQPAYTEPAAVPVEIDASTQYELNIFLSNFSEQNFCIFDGAFNVAGARAEDLMHFAQEHYVMNKHTLMQQRYGEYGNYGNTYMTGEEVETTVERYFATDFSCEGAVYFYMNMIEWQGMYFSVAQSAVLEPDGTWTVEFAVYSAIIYDPEGPASSAVEQRHYYMTPEQAAAEPNITWEYSGTARVEPYNYNGRNTYRLISYQING